MGERTGARTMPRTRQTICILLTLALLAGGQAFASVDPAGVATNPSWEITRVSVTESGGDANGDAWGVSLNVDGSKVGLVSTASNLGVNGEGSNWDVYLRDLSTGKYEVIDLREDGSHFTEPADLPKLSADASRVVFSAGWWSNRRPYIRDRTAGITKPAGYLQNIASPAISADGTRVAFIKRDDYWHDSDDRAYAAMFDVETDTVRYVVSPTHLKDHVASLALSTDGNWLAYVLERYGFNTPKLYLLDVSDIENPGEPMLISTGGPDAHAGLGISANGRYVAYVDYDLWPEVPLLYDAWSQTTTPLVDMPEGSDIAWLKMSDDAAVIAFYVTNWSARTDHLWVHDRTSGRTEVIAPVDSYADFDLSRDGSVVAFSTYVDGITPDDQNGQQDIYLARRGDSEDPSWPAGAALRAEQTGATLVRIGWDEAVDDRGVDAYEVTRDGVVVAEGDASLRSHTSSGLEPDTEYGFAVRARDVAGKWSAPLTLSVRTLPPAQPGQAQLVVERLTGGRARLTWEAAAESPDGYRVWRAKDDEEANPVVDVDPAATTFDDAGLHASATYRYLVTALRGEASQPHTVESRLSLEALSAQYTTWVGRPHPGTSLAITIDAQPGWDGFADVRYRSWFDDDGNELAQPAETSRRLPAVEDPSAPGTYRATLAIAEGMAEISSIDGGIADGGGNEATAGAARLPLKVWGVVDLNVDAPPGSLPGARAVVTSGTVAAHAPLDGGALVRLGPVRARDDYTLTVVSEDGLELGTIAPFAVRPGRIEAASIKPDHPATLRVEVRSGDGKIVPKAQVEVSDEHGRSLALQPTLADGRTHLGRLLAGRPLTVTVTAPEHLRTQRRAGRSVTLVPGQNATAITIPMLPAGVLEGTVVDDRGRPAGGAYLAIAQEIDGRTWTTGVEAGSDGRYEANVLAGGARAIVSYLNDPPFTTVESAVPAGGRATLDVTLPPLKKYSVTLNLFTRYGDSPEQGPLPIDWRVAVHFAMQLSGPAGVALPRANVVDVEANIGDVLEWCAGGHEANLNSACTSVTLGDERRVALDLHLSNEGVVRGSVAGPRSSVAISMYKESAPGSTRWGWTAWDGSFELGIPEEGTYVLQLDRYRDGNPNTPPQTRRITFTATGGDVDLGVLELEQNDWMRRSAITPSASQVATGGTVEVRAEIHPGRTTAVNDATLSVPLPPGTAFVPGSALLDGTPVTPGVGSDAISIPLGSRTFTAKGSGEAWVARFRARVTGAKVGTSLAVSPRVHWKSSPEAAPALDPIGSGWFRVAGVTLDAPPGAAKRTLTLSGLAPKGARVSVFDRAVFIGEAVAGAGGVWRAEVTLPDRGNGFRHSLRAEIELDGTRIASAVRRLTFDERRPQLSSITVSQPDGRHVQFDPAAGLARFPYVIAQDRVDVTMRFDGSGTVESARARIGTSDRAAVEQADGSFRASVNPPWSELGPVWIDHRSAPAPIHYGDEPKPTEAQLRLRLPHGVAAYENLTTRYEDGPVGLASLGAATNHSPTKTGTVEVDLPALGPEGKMTTTMSLTRGLTYTPTSNDLAAVRATGAPFYGLTWSHTLTATGITVNVDGYVPEEELDEQPSPAAAFSALAQGLRRQPGPPRAETKSASSLGVARVGFQVAFSGAQTIDSLNTALTAGDKYDQLNALLDVVTANCSGSAANRYRNELDTLSKEALAADAAHAALMVAGLALAPATFGVGTLAVWLVTFIADKAVDYAMEKSIAGVAAQIAADEECRDEDDAKDPDDPDRDDDDDDDSNDDDDQKVAEPKWIFDPSGYVFEAVESNRVEGVVATLVEGATENGPFWPWDAEWYGQENPLVTDADGRYGWDVPEGWWQVRYHKDGYAPAASAVLRVLPPHFDVNVGIVSYAPPQVARIAAIAGDETGVDVTFDRYMKLSVAADDVISVGRASGTPIPGTVVALDAEMSPGGEVYAREFRFAPAEPISIGESLNVDIAETATSYSGSAMLARVSRVALVERYDAPALACRASVVRAAGSEGLVANHRDEPCEDHSVGASADTPLGPPPVADGRRYELPGGGWLQGPAARTRGSGVAEAFTGEATLVLPTGQTVTIAGAYARAALACAPEGVLAADSWVGDVSLNGERIATATSEPLTVDLPGVATLSLNQTVSEGGRIERRAVVLRAGGEEVAVAVAEMASRGAVCAGDP